MPPKIRFTKEGIIGAALDITRRSGLGAVNARALAAEMGCSTQPLFREFNSVDEIHMAVDKRAREIYSARIKAAKTEDKPVYKAMGLAYIKFAKEEPELFKLIFMRDRSKDGTMNAQDDENADEIFRIIAARTGFTLEKAREMHIHLWIYVHGLAVMLATRYIEIDDAMLDSFLSLQFNAILRAMKERGDV